MENITLFDITLEIRELLKEILIELKGGKS